MARTQGNSYKTDLPQEQKKACKFVPFAALHIKTWIETNYKAT